MRNDKVSIVLPTYNGAKYIRQSIDSCLNQSYRNIELIIVDDCSTDTTPQIIKSYKDNRIRYIRHEKNERIPRALNSGFAIASGSYMTWTSDDNLYAKKAIEKMLLYLKQHKCSFIYCDYYNFKNNKISEKTIARLPNSVSLKNGNCIGACFLYTREIMEAIGDYDADTELAEDYDYWIRVSRKFPLCHLDEPLYFFRRHEESMYMSRFIEVKVVDFLVRLKNKLLDINHVNNLFLGLITKRRRGPLRLNKILVRVNFSRRIKRILIEFESEKINFKEARGTLTNLLRKILSS